MAEELFKKYNVMRDVTGAPSVTIYHDSELPRMFDPAPPQLLRLFYEGEYAVQAIIGVLDGAVMVKERITPKPEPKKEVQSPRQLFVRELECAIKEAQRYPHNDAVAYAVRYILDALKIILEWEKRGAKS